jgi:hypothetical protein
MFYQLILSFCHFDVCIFISIDFRFKVQIHMQRFENIHKPKKILHYIENDDGINCTMQIPSTYVKFVFMQFSKKLIK